MPLRSQIDHRHDRPFHGKRRGRLRVHGGPWTVATATATAAAASVLVEASPAAAYIGPGAGFALGGSFIFALVGFLLALLALLLWPVRVLIRSIRARRRAGRARVRRVVVLGLDGLDPSICRQMWRRGELPHLRRLKEEGGFRPLVTTYPAMSPVGWSTFATGVDASGHNIFDFLTRDRSSHLPVLSSTRITHTGKARRIGRWVLTRAKAKIELLRRSKPFWTTLGEAGIESTILRVPITFPPDRFSGRMVSAMCVPDLRGTQGTFTHYVARDAEVAGGAAEKSRKKTGGDGDGTGADPSAEMTGGVHQPLHPAGAGTWRGDLLGPDGENGSGPQRIPFTVKREKGGERIRFKIGTTGFALGSGEDSEWVEVAFGSGRGKARGICKFRVTSFADPLSVYVTPIHLDPARPAMPIANPPHLAIALAKLHGPFATLGLAEDTWALNERVIDEQAFWDQAWSIFAERKQQFFHALDRQPTGVVTVVVDTTDRLQHMFFRYLEPDHPANRGKDTERHRDAIFELYRRADALVGETQAKLKDDEALLVCSDHGFKSFRRGVNLNAWFRDEGYLYLKSDPADGPPPPLPADARFEPREIDWPRTRAYTNGLAGFYLNIQGRERDGCVPPDEVATLKRKLIDALRGLPDDDCNDVAISELWAAEEIYPGPYRENGPDVIVGYKPGYRADWDAAVGRVTAHVIQDNARSWSGDHCMDPRQVPGVLFASLPFAPTRPSLEDMAPTVLDLLGVAAPPHMTGRSIFAPTPVRRPTRHGAREGIKT